MDFILHKINERISLLQVTDSTRSLGVYYRSRIEYLFTLMLGYLWNKNFETLAPDTKLEVFSAILRPTIGDIVSTCRSLDIKKEFFSVKNIANSINGYPELRNSQMGHGFIYEDASENADSGLIELYSELVSNQHFLFGQNNDFIYVQRQDNNMYKGVLYASNGATRPWSCSKEVANFNEDNLYFQVNGEFHCLSPFIKIENAGDNIYIYGKIAEKLLGRIHYNRLVNTGTIDTIWEPFSHLSIVNDGLKIRTTNGTIRNIYENNYTTYIDVGVRSKILKFLKESKASVCATLWGHGGIGKTATIQNVCDILSNKEYKTFDYIVFISAKDRRYNYYKGIIESVNTEISTYSDVIRALNAILYEDDSVDERNIINYDGLLLLVLDDFESFAKEEANKLSDFISRLDINHHKVVVTTRSASVALGLEIKTNELDVEQTAIFLNSLIDNEGILLSIEDKETLNKLEVKKQVHEITSGRPLFIYQLGHIIGQKGLVNALKNNIKKGGAAVDFLYGRIYEYLSPKAKDLFVVISLLVTKDDMMNVLDKAQYIMNMEDDDEGFASVVEELKKLKIVKVTDEENRYFEVYSREILEMMNKHFAMRDSIFIKNCNNRRTQVNKDKNADIEVSLLNNANSSRLVKSEIETVDSYKQILNRPTSPLAVKMSAIFNLANYLLVDRGKRINALDIFEKYSHFFTGIAFGKEERSLYATFALRWSTTNWANGTAQQKQKAISILSDYYKGKVDFNRYQDIEISATLLMYRSLMVIKDWRELKDKFQFNEISFSDFKSKRDDQKKECQSLLTYIGNPLYIKVSRNKLTDFPSSTRQSLITAFFNYIDVLVRIDKKKLALEVCEYVITCGPRNFIPQFESKRSWLISLK